MSEFIEKKDESILSEKDRERLGRLLQFAEECYPERIVYAPSIIFKGSCDALKKISKKLGYASLADLLVVYGFEAPDGTIKKSNGKKIISIPEGIKKIPKSAFFGQEDIVSVNLPSSLEGIEEFAFYRCSSLESISIPDGVKRIGKNAFSDCTSLKMVRLPKDTPELGERAFYNCNSLQSINIIPDEDALKKNVFTACTSCVSITDDNNMLIINGTLYLYSGSEKTVVIPDVVKYIFDYAFYNKDQVEEITIPDAVYSIGCCAFKDCKRLRSICIPPLVRKIEIEAFRGCDNLQKVELSEGLEEIGSSAFAYCYSLNKITLPYSLRSIESRAFLYCERLSEIRIPKRVTSIGFSSGETFYGCESLSELIIPDGVKVINQYEFSKCKNLKRIVLPKSLHTIKRGAFAYCENLEELTVPENDVRAEGDIIEGCKKIDKKQIKRICDGNAHKENQIENGSESEEDIITHYDSISLLKDKDEYLCAHKEAFENEYKRRVAISGYHKDVWLKEFGELVDHIQDVSFENTTVCLADCEELVYPLLKENPCNIDTSSFLLHKADYLIVEPAFSGANEILKTKEMRKKGSNIKVLLAGEVYELIKESHRRSV